MHLPPSLFRCKPGAPAPSPSAVSGRARDPPLHLPTALLRRSCEPSAAAAAVGVTKGPAAGSAGHGDPGGVHSCRMSLRPSPLSIDSRSRSGPPHSPPLYRFSPAASAAAAACYVHTDVLGAQALVPGECSPPGLDAAAAAAAAAAESDGGGGFAGSAPAVGLDPAALHAGCGCCCGVDGCAAVTAGAGCGAESGVSEISEPDEAAIWYY